MLADGVGLQHIFTIAARVKINNEHRFLCFQFLTSLYLIRSKYSVTFCFISTRLPSRFTFLNIFLVLQKKQSFKPCLWDFNASLCQVKNSLIHCIQNQSLYIDLYRKLVCNLSKLLKNLAIKKPQKCHSNKPIINQFI